MSRLDKIKFAIGRRESETERERVRGRERDRDKERDFHHNKHLYSKREIPCFLFIPQVTETHRIRLEVLIATSWG